jgi:hypothetical protein
MALFWLYGSLAPVSATPCYWGCRRRPDFVEQNLTLSITECCERLLRQPIVDAFSIGNRSANKPTRHKAAA